MIWITVIRDNPGYTESMSVLRDSKIVTNIFRLSVHLCNSFFSSLCFGWQGKSKNRHLVSNFLLIHLIYSFFFQLKFETGL